MRVCVVVPARMASERLPQKPLQLIGDVPMIVQVMRNLQSAVADEIIAAVDHIDVYRAVHDAGFPVEMTSTDHPSGSDRVMEVAGLRGLSDDDVVINVQGDEPLMPVSIVDELTSLMRQRTDIELATVSEPIESALDFVNPNVVKVVTDLTGQALYFSRAPIPYVRDASLESLSPQQLRRLGVRRHVGVYAFRVGALAQFVNLSRDDAAALEGIEKLEQLRWLQAGRNIHVIPSPKAIPGGVDTPDDLERVRALINSN